MSKARSWHLSASAIAEFKRCPYAFMLKYVKGIRRAEDTEAQRYGTNWHTVLEILSLPPRGPCTHCAKRGEDGVCLYCMNAGLYPDDLMDTAIRVLDEAYRNVPPSMDPDEWETEKIKILYSASAYRWYYADDQLEPVVREYKFRTPVPRPDSTRNLQRLLLDGVIDKIVERNGRRFVVEHKSTGSSLDDVETTTKFWAHLNLDTQTLLYPFICGIVPELAELGVSGVLYDAFHKPTIKPKMLTQGESKTFVESGEYCGQKFIVKHLGIEDTEVWEINGKIAEIKPGAKEGTFAIRETPEMYGARLLQDICSRPQFYFARREIPRTADDLARFNKELHNVYQMIKLAHSADCWFHNERQCEATFKCDYIDLCYNGVSPDAEQLPAGLVRTLDKKKETVAA